MSAAVVKTEPKAVRPSCTDLTESLFSHPVNGRLKYSQKAIHQPPLLLIFVLCRMEDDLEEELTAQCREEAESLVKELMTGFDISHDYLHVDRVRKTGRWPAPYITASSNLSQRYRLPALIGIGNWT